MHRVSLVPPRIITNSSLFIQSAIVASQLFSGMHISDRSITTIFHPIIIDHHSHSLIRVTFCVSVHTPSCSFNQSSSDRVELADVNFKS